MKNMMPVEKWEELFSLLDLPEWIAYQRAVEMEGI